MFSGMKLQLLLIIYPLCIYFIGIIVCKVLKKDYKRYNLMFSYLPFIILMNLIPQVQRDFFGNNYFGVTFFFMILIGICFILYLEQVKILNYKQKKYLFFGTTFIGSFTYLGFLYIAFANNLIFW